MKARWTDNNCFMLIDAFDMPGMLYPITPLKKNIINNWKLKLKLLFLLIKKYNKKILILY